MAAALQQFERIQHFIEVEGLHPDATFEGKPTAVCYALLKSNIRLVRYLFSKGAQVNQADVVGMTPLHYAALGGCEYCLATVIGLGASLNVANRCGKTALAMTLDKPNLGGCREMLTGHGASVVPGCSVMSRLH